MPTLFWDIETRSAAPLQETGAWRYAADRSTEVLCIGYAVDNGDVKIWTPGQPIPEEFVAAAANPNWIIVAHNDQFERVIEERILAPHFGWPIVPINRHRCTMAAALACALPAKLETVAKVLDLPIQKDVAGVTLMRMMAGPRKPRADEDPSGLYWHDDPAKLERLYAYCQNDVEVERELFHQLPRLTDLEQKLWELDAIINRRGFYTDGPLLEAASTIAAAAGTAVQTELASITSGELISTDQVSALLDWLAEHGCEVKDLRKPTLKQALRRKDLDPAVRRAMDLRLGAAHAAAAKIDTLLAWRDSDGRIRGTLRYHGAGTGRWTGHGPQPQNFKRDSEGVDEKVAAVATGNLAHIGELYLHPLEIVGDIARAMICAKPDHRLLIGDFSGIESRVTAWVSGQQSKLEQWAKFDRTGDPKDEPYYINGHNCGLPDETARGIGKTADLAFGFQGGAAAWRKLAPDDDASDVEILRRRNIWRKAHPHTVAFWRGINRTAITAVRRPNSTLTYKRLTLTYDERFLRIVLPSGRPLSYPLPRLETDKFDNPMVVFKDNAAGKFVDCRFGQGAYGGLWIENIVQAISRDLLAAAMMRLEAAEYPVVLHVHDEIVVEAPVDFGSLEEFQRLITASPDWANGLPIAAKVRNGERFSKSEKKQAAANAEAPQPTKQTYRDEINAGLKREGIEPIDWKANDGATDLPWHSDGGASKITNQRASQTVEPEPVHSTPVENEPNSENSGVGANREPGPNPGANGGAIHTGSGNNYPRGEHRSGRRIAVYFYQDHLKNPHTRVEKWWSAKAQRAQFPQSFRSGNRWISQKPKGWTRVPYRLPEMLEALTKDPTIDVFLPEGEKDCETLRGLGLIASTNSEGATALKAKVGKWTPELSRWFHGVRRLFIPADNDEVGRAFAREKARALEAIVPDIRIIMFLDVPEGEDVSHWLNELGHTKADLLVRCEAAERWQDSVTLESVRASAVTMEVIDWLWPDYFAVGEIGLLVGLPDEGKGQVLSYIAARVTRGQEWPNGGGCAPQGNIILLTSEDDIKKTVTPRLVAAGADCARIEIIKMVRDLDKDGRPRERMFSLIDDLQRLRRKIAEVGGVIAILIDPISAYLGIGRVDSYRGSDVRAVLGPLKTLAEDLQIAVIGIMHFNKKVDITNVLLRTQDSLAFVAAPRHVFGVIDDADNHRKLVVRAKNNLVDSGQKRKSLAFHFDVQHVGADHRNNKPIIAPFIVWETGYVDISATEALQAASENKSPAATDEAKRFLLDMLANGPVAKKEIEDAAEGCEISLATLRRAKRILRVIAEKDRASPTGGWFWKLPQQKKEV
jgi:DNA polymerase